MSNQLSFEWDIIFLTFKDISAETGMSLACLSSKSAKNDKPGLDLTPVTGSQNPDGSGVLSVPSLPGPLGGLTERGGRAQYDPSDVTSVNTRTLTSGDYQSVLAAGQQ